MWIRSQNKKTLIDTNHVYMDEPVYGNRICAISGIDSFEIIGDYESEKRLIEILDEIQSRIWEIERMKLFPQDGFVNPIYEMPEN